MGSEAPQVMPKVKDWLCWRLENCFLQQQRKLGFHHNSGTRDTLETSRHSSPLPRSTLACACGACPIPSAWRSPPLPLWPGAWLPAPPGLSARLMSLVRGDISPLL